MNDFDLSRWLPELEEHVWVYLQDWALVYLVGGGIMALVGMLVGWSVWGRARSLARSIEEKVKTQRTRYEEANEELSRLERETSPAAQHDFADALNR